MTNECIHGLSRQKMYTRTVVESYQQWPEMGYECAKYSIFYQVYNTQESSVVKCVAKKIKYYALFEPRHNWHRCTHHIRSAGMVCMQHCWKQRLVPRTHNHSA